MDRIVLATANPHKVRELRLVFADTGLPILSLDEAARGDTPPEPEETGATFEENARLKARWYAARLGEHCLADDSGLEVDALGGAPGVISSHYCTGGRDAGMTRDQRDRANNELLLRSMQNVPEPGRAARFVCVMCLATPDGRVLAESRGTFEGRIGREPGVPRGDNGFGYDPIFLLPAPDNRTSAELSPEEKNRRSHRGAAARAMAAQLQRLRARRRGSAAGSGNGLDKQD